MSGPIFVDVQRFEDNDGNWLPVEIAVTDNECNLMEASFYIPYYISVDFNEETTGKNEDLHKQHSFRYMFGRKHVDRFQEVLKSNVPETVDVYSMGVEQCAFLSKCLGGRDVNNIEDLQYGEDPFPTFPNVCTTHRFLQNSPCKPGMKPCVGGDHQNPPLCAVANVNYYKRIYNLYSLQPNELTLDSQDKYNEFVSTVSQQLLEIDDNFYDVRSILGDMEDTFSNLKSFVQSHIG
jgi:hypothetical protein